MCNSFSSIMAGAFFDQAMQGQCSCFEGSLFNPLQTMMLLSTDPETQGNYDAERMAKAVGVPADWFTTEKLVAPVDEVITALGKSALIYLSAMRSLEIFDQLGIALQDDALRAPEAFTEVVGINERLKAASGLPATRYEDI